jgi:hypothetical protein
MGANSWPAAPSSLARVSGRPTHRAIWRVLKGYGATYDHGNESFALLMRAAVRLRGTDGAAVEFARLRDAALADEDGVQPRTRLAESTPGAC